MLKALLHGKSRLLDQPYEPRTALDDYRDREDLLTSFVFGALIYLPADWLWRIFRSASIDATVEPQSMLPEAIGALERADFWPSWWLKSTSGVRRRVEPDVFLSYEACDVIVEAKRHDGQQMQHSAQLARELVAYFQTRGAGKPVYLLAVGGMLTADPQATQLLRQAVSDELAALISSTQVPPHRVEVVPWVRVLRAVRAMLETLALSREHRAILEDVEAVFGLHRIVDWRPTWLSDLAKSISDHHLAAVDWARLPWRAAVPAYDARKKGSEQWWRAAANLRAIDERAQRLFERLVGERL
jgi:hypothetical protein